MDQGTDGVAGDDVLALKRNQGNFHKAVVDYVDGQLETNFQGIGARRHETHERGYGREEHRISNQFPVPQNLTGRRSWKGLKTIGVAMLTTVCHGKETHEMRYYISSQKPGVKEFARAVRGHWRIESGASREPETAPKLRASARFFVAPGFSVR